MLNHRNACTRRLAGRDRSSAVQSRDVGLFEARVFGFCSGHLFLDSETQNPAGPIDMIGWRRL